MSLVRAKQKELNAKFVEACFDGHHRIADQLLNDGAFMESVERNGYSALSEACIAGHTIVVGQLLRALADPNSRANDGRTPLHRAAFHGWQPVVSLLLDNGADPTRRDEQGTSAADLSRSPLVRKQINDYSTEKTQEAQKEWKRKLAAKPARASPAPEEDEAPAAADENAAAAGDTAAFRPPPRGSSAAYKAEKEEKKAQAEAKKKEAADTAKADKERRQQRYKEAMDEMKELITSGQDLGEAGYNIADAPRPLTAKVEVLGAPEARLNGIYQVQFATKDRIEFSKVSDEMCQIFWSSWQDEWRMLIGDYKMGSTLYRNSYRPNWKADVCHGVPEDKWQKWFGKDGVPTVRLLPDDTTLAARLGEIADESEVCVEQPASPSASATGADAAGERQTKKTSEFLELHSKLDIVSVDDGASRRAAAASSLSSSGQSNEIQLTLGGERIVETADGLFGAGDVQVVADNALPVIEEPDQDTKARQWLESSGTSPALPVSWESIVAAKGTAQELYTEQKIREAVEATTAAVITLEKFARPIVSDDSEDGSLDADRNGRPSEEEIESMRGVLHSNRSLLLQHQILAGDSDVLAFGADAAWRLVVNDADVALRVNPTNFKASFRRARALLELGDLDEALQDATNVVDHYASTSSTPNPEAAALREQILEAVKEERCKWGEKGPRRWNRSAKDLITEVSSSCKQSEAAGKENKSKQVETAMPWDAKPAPAAASRLPKSLPDTSSKQLPAPKTSSDVEKALLVTLKKNPQEQLAYLREHLSTTTLRRFYKRLPLGPDLLSRYIRIAADLVEEDAPRTEDLMCTLAGMPSAKTDAAMFDADEQAVLQRLTSRLGSKATEAWAD